MPISPAAIANFLAHKHPAAPPVKELPDDVLYGIVNRFSGAPYTPTTPPRRHQLAGMAFLATQNNALLFYGMRSGKTKLILDRFQHLKRLQKARKALIIVPNPVIRPVWISESSVHTPELRLRTIANDPLDFVDAANDDSVDMVVCSWSSLQNIFCVKREVKKRNIMAADFDAINLAAQFFDFGAIDEIHGAKDHESLRFNICRALFSNTTSRIGCTGTPFGRDPFALWSQAYLIDNGQHLGKSYYFFKSAFGKFEDCFFSGSGKKIVYDEDKFPKLVEKTQSLALSYTMFECGVEKVMPNVVKLKMTKEQSEHYRKAANKILEMPDGSNRRENAFHTLRMISSGYVPYNDEMGEKRVALLHGTPKLAWLQDLMENASDGAAIVVFHWYEHTGRIICNELKKKKIKHSWLYGSTSDKGGAVDKFKCGEVDWLVLNLASGNAGIDLRRADYQLYFENPTSPIIRQQSEARALGERGGRSLFIDDLVCSRIEERILDFHRQGLDLLAKSVFQDSDFL